MNTTPDKTRTMDFAERAAVSIYGMQPQDQRDTHSLDDTQRILDTFAKIIRDALDDSDILAWLAAKRDAAGIKGLTLRVTAWDFERFRCEPDFTASALDYYTKGMPTIEGAIAELRNPHKNLAEAKRAQITKLQAELAELEKEKP